MDPKKNAMSTPIQKIRRLYQVLRTYYGPQYWWPAKTTFEVVAGAYLTQNTSWNNVEKALNRLRKAGKLNIEGIRSLSMRELQRLIRASGFFRQKSRSLKAFIHYLDSHHAGSLRRMFARARTSSAAVHALRQELLQLNGVGRETADSILLYGGNLPVFVVDTYTRRIFLRHRLISDDASYDDVRKLVERALAEGSSGETKAISKKQAAQSRRECARHFNEMHALLVSVGKDYCFKSAPDCDGCPLRKLLPRALHEEARGRRR